MALIITKLGTRAVRFDINGIVKRFACPVTLANERGDIVVINAEHETIRSRWQDITLDGAEFASIDDALQQLGTFFGGFKVPEGTGSSTPDDSKLPKIATPQRVYTTGENGEQGSLPYSQTQEPNAIAQRDNSGRLAVIGDVSGAYAISAEQVDAKIAVHAEADKLMFEKLVADMHALQYTPEQIQQIVNIVIESAGADVATKTWVIEQLTKLVNETIPVMIGSAVSDAYAAAVSDMYRIAQEVYKGLTPELDMTYPVTVAGKGGVLGVASVTEWTVPANGGIVCTYAGVIGTANVAVNGTDYPLVSLLGIPASKTIPVRTGDIVSVADILTLLGALTITFYPNA